MVRARLVVFAALTLGLADFGAFAVEFPRFTVHRIDHFGRNIGQTALVDVDRDGDLDWIAGNSSYSGPGGGEICWWVFQEPDKWTRHTLGKGNTDAGADSTAFDHGALHSLRRDLLGDELKDAVRKKYSLSRFEHSLGVHRFDEDIRAGRAARALGRMEHHSFAAVHLNKVAFHI